MAAMSTTWSCVFDLPPLFLSLSALFLSLSPLFLSLSPLLPQSNSHYISSPTASCSLLYSFYNSRFLLSVFSRSVLSLSDSFSHSHLHPDIFIIQPLTFLPSSIPGSL